MRCVVTGASGFIGQHLVHRLIAGRHDVITWDLRAQGGVHTPWMPDVVFHLAATRRSEDNFLNAELLCRVDEWFSNPHIKIINVSTIQSRNPMSMYAVSKRAAELYAAMRVDQGRDIRTLRLANVYGPGQLPPAVIPAFIDGTLTSKPLIITEREARDFIYIKDVVDGVMTAAFADSVAPSMDIATGVETLITDLPLKILMLTAGSQEFEYRPQQNKVWDNRADVSIMSNRCKWMAKTSLQTGLQETIKWHKSRLSTTA